VRSVLASRFRDLELILLDQSDDDSTWIALASESASDPRFCYQRLGTPGKPKALNRGRALARGKYLLLTDDDCEVLPDWIDKVIAEFDTDPALGCVFGRVDAGSYNPAEVYVPVCAIERTKTIHDLDELLTMPGWGNFGMGANMALRREVVDRLLGWDACIGPGAKFGSGDDHDMSVRVLRAGYAIRFSPAPRVIHYGFRRLSTTGGDQRRTWYGVGGVFAKHLRCGALYKGGLRGPVYQLRSCAVSVLRGRKPYGLSYVASWCRGLAAGLVHPVNRATSQFVASGEDNRYGNRFAEVVLRPSLQRNAVQAPDQPSS
jgi:glycosyltransferase involved in cell wall biosynthesis